MSRFLSKRFAAIKPYTPGEQPKDQKYIKLNTNESPYPPSPQVLSAIDIQQVGRLHIYPDPEASPLIEAIAQYYQVDTQQIFVGNGSDEILAFSFLAFADQENKVCFPDITYGFYQVYADLFNIEAVQFPLKEDLSIDFNDYLNCGHNIFIANPNAPTGICLSLEQIELILQTNPDQLVFIDEAYIDFGGISCLSLLPKYDNLLICGTFSKSRSLAGARLGYAIASPPIIEDLNKIKFSFNPYNINRLSMIAATAAITDKDYFHECCNKIIETREKTSAGLKALGFTLTDSKANFLFARHDKLGGEEYYLQLKQRGILVRHFKQERISEYVRITIGSPKEMEELLRCTAVILDEGGLL
ncbi:MAG: histidinol-phosphate transaminase [Bacillota bacterium]|jgi:histidinol-phosphate aminotransferase